MFHTAKVGRLNQAGFTLVELMVVVAIIGILAAIAIPNFQRYQAKSRQKEAQIALSAAYTAMRTFQSEQGSYSACLEQSGYIPTGDVTVAGIPGGRRWYTHGFQTAAGGTLCGPAGATSCLTFNYAPVTTCTDAAVAFGAALNISDLAYAATQTIIGTAATVALLDQTDLPIAAAGAVTASTFDISAIGNISNNAAAVVDTWTVDENKALNNTILGM